MEELILDGIKYRIDFKKDDAGFRTTWSCPACRCSGLIGLSGGTEEEAKQALSDKVRKHHADTHAATP